MISLEMVGYRDSKPGSQSYPVYVNATELSGYWRFYSGGR